MANYATDTKYENDIKDDILEKKENLSEGEKCTNKIAKKHGLVKNGKIDNNIIPVFDENKINKYKNDDDKEYEYNLCYEKKNEDDNKEYSFNCALDNKNIWLTKNEDDKCEINNNIDLLPSGLEKVDDKITKLKKPKSYKFIKNLDISTDSDNICQERWYDWFTIPDYHNGNKYSIELGDDGNTFKCFKPCPYGSISIKSSEQSMIVKNTKCVNRDLIDNGKLKNTLPYNPYSLIFLFGCTKNDLIEMYKYELTDINKKIDDLNKNDNNFKLELNDNLFNQIIQNDETIENIISGVIQEIQYYVKLLITEPISHLNIVAPYNNINELNYNPTKYYSNKFYLNKAYNISKKIYQYNTDENLSKDFYEWKNELSKVNNFNMNTWEFNKCLLLLHQCCNLCFGYQNPKQKQYDKQQTYNNYVMNNLTKHYDYEILKIPMVTEKQILKSINTNNPLHNLNSDDIKRISNDKIKEYQIDSKKIEKELQEIYKLDSNDYKFNENKIFLRNHKGFVINNLNNFFLKSSCDMIDINLINNSLTSCFIKLFTSFITIFVIIVFLFMCYLLIMAVWSSFTNVFNYIFIGILWILSTFYAIFQILRFKTSRTRSFILEIHSTALKLEYIIDVILQKLAANNSKSQVVFKIIYFAACIFTMVYICKIFADMFIIYSSSSSTRKDCETCFIC